jgi:hypothetical protein
VLAPLPSSYSKLKEDPAVNGVTVPWVTSAPWQGKLEPEASRGSLMALPGIGTGFEMKKWAFADAKSVAAMADLKTLLYIV